MKSVWIILFALFTFCAVYEVAALFWPAALPTPWDRVRAIFGKYLARYFMWKIRREKLIWQCLRDGGGGMMVTPHPMTEAQAVRWLIKRTNAEVFYTDRRVRSILYRSRV